MKKVKLTILEYCTFKELAEKFKILYSFKSIKEEQQVEVEADESILTNLGY